jgi:hypothetical protein
MTTREELLEEAKALGLSFAKNITTEKLEAAVVQAQAEKLAEDSFVEAGGELDTPEPPMTETAIRAQIEAEYAQKLIIERARLTANMEINMAETSDKAADNRVAVGQAKLKSRREALSLVRVNITCKDPMKTSWTGELFSAGNDVIGSVTKYVQFNTEIGYHLPRIIYNVLKTKKCTIFVNKRVNGQCL